MDAHFREEYRQHAGLLRELGVSEAMYVLSRRIDTGLEPLEPECVKEAQSTGGHHVRPGSPIRS